MKHTIIVGNIGTVYDGTDKIVARNEYRQRVWDSKNNNGHGAGENVTWMRDGEPYKEHAHKPLWPSIRSLQALLTELKGTIGDEYRASEDPEDDTPGMCVTIGADGKGHDNWSYQTGDNSYSGGAYHYAHWGVVSLYRNSNCTDLAKDIINQLEESFHV